MGHADPQAFGRGSTGQNLEEDLGRRTDVNRDHSVFLFPAQWGLLQMEMTSGCLKRGKLGQLSVLQGLGHWYGCEMGSILHGSVCGKMKRDAKSHGANAPSFLLH